MPGIRKMNESIAWQYLQCERVDLDGQESFPSARYGIIDFMEPSKIQIQEELLLAKQSRLEGNEGRARVCARRAAGAAVKEYLGQKGIAQKKENAIQALLTLRQSEDIPERVVEALNCLVQRVDQDHKLPMDADLIFEAGIVIQFVEAGRE